MYYFALSDCEGNLQKELEKNRGPRDPYLEFEMEILNKTFDHFSTEE
jgi:hypothetical protein